MITKTQQFSKAAFIANPSNCQLTTREGNPVRLLSTEGSKKYPIVGVVNDFVEEWTVDGDYCMDDLRQRDEDLMMSVTEHYPAPIGSNWHNPDRLTPQQVGAGYRLKIQGEITTAQCQMFDHVHFSSGDRWVEIPTDFHGSKYVTDHGAARTMRCPISTPFPDGSVLQPDGSYIRTPSATSWTLDQVPIGSVVKWKENNYRSAILGVNPLSITGVALAGRWESPETMLDEYTMDDGSPCGIVTK